MNGFSKHNIKHTSASSINLWADCPGAWAARYLFDKKFSFGVAPQIGMLVEEICAKVLTKEASFEKALEMAHTEFNRNNALNTSTKDRERIKDIEAMATLALKELEPYGEPEYIRKITGREQQRIELKCNGKGWELPVIGFLDFKFPQHGILYDLKTTLRLPSTMSEPHKRQGAIYKKASGNMEVRFLYVSPKKTITHIIENENETLQDVKNILNRQERFLSLHDKEAIRKIIPINHASYMWGGSEHIKKELFED